MPKQELKQERDKAEAAARELTSLRAELDAARAAGLEAVRTAEAAKIEQRRHLGKNATRPRRSLASLPRRGRRPRSVPHVSLPRTPRCYR